MVNKPIPQYEVCFSIHNYENGRIYALLTVRRVHSLYFSFGLYFIVHKVADNFGVCRDALGENL